MAQDENEEKKALAIFVRRQKKNSLSAAEYISGVHNWVFWIINIKTYKYSM